jgi:EmrB/QacA subfamily drug resistance transporter
VGTVCIGAFMGQVDSSITQLLLPRLESEFNAQLSTVSWVAVAYLLAMAAFLPIFGRLADILGRKLLYTGGFLLFVLSSGLCGLAPNLPVLIAFRVIQGIGAALLSSNSVAIVVAAAGGQMRGRALGIQAAAQAVGLSAGPAIGGLVLDVLDWRWVFFINVPVGLAGTIMGWFVLPPTRDLPADARFDWNGALLIAPALTAVMVVLNEGYAWGATSPLLLGAALLAVILLVLFVRCERSADAPLIDLALFRNRAGQHRRPPVLCRVVRAVLSDAVRARARLSRFDPDRGTAAVHRSRADRGRRAGGGRPLRQARGPGAHRRGHAHRGRRPGDAGHRS